MTADVSQFFASPSKRKADRSSSRTSTPALADAEVIDLAQLDEDDEDQAVGEEDFVPAAEVDARPAKRKKDHSLGPSCPICQNALGPSTTNQELNDHVDMCLNKDAIRLASKASPKSVKRPKSAKQDGGNDKGMMRWLQKGA